MSVLLNITEPYLKEENKVKYIKSLTAVSLFLANEFMGCAEKNQLCDELCQMKISGNTSQDESEFIQDSINLAKRYREKEKTWLDEKIKNKEYAKLSNHHLELLCKQKRLEFKDRLDAITQLQQEEPKEKKRDEDCKDNKMKYNFVQKLNELEDKSFLDDFIEWDRLMGFVINRGEGLEKESDFEDKKYPKQETRKFYLETLEKN